MNHETWLAIMDLKVRKELTCFPLEATEGFYAVQTTELNYQPLKQRKVPENAEVLKM